MHVCFIAASAEKRLAKSDTATDGGEGNDEVRWVPSMDNLRNCLDDFLPPPYRANGAFFSIHANSLPLSPTLD